MFGKKTTATKPQDDRESTPEDAGAGTPPTEMSSAELAREAELKLLSNPTLAVYGDRDVFVSAKKLRDWARRLEAAPGSRFRAHEVSTAGHFWTEEGVLFILRDAVKTFARGLITPDTVVEAGK